MAFRVEQSRGLVVSDEGWSFSLDCEGGVALLELDGLRLRVRPLRWSEKNRLARTAHMGEALVRRQLVRACLLDEGGGAALSERQQEVVARLVMWLGGQHGGLDEDFPLDSLALAGVTLGVCRATGLKPSDLDEREAAEVEMLWMAAGGRAQTPDAPAADTHPADVPDTAASGVAPAAAPARWSPYAQDAAQGALAPSDDFTRIVIVPDAAAAPHAPDARDVEADRHARAHDSAEQREGDVRPTDVRGVVGAEGRAFVGAEGSAVVGDFEEGVATRVQSSPAWYAERQTRVTARGAELPAPSRPAPDGGTGVAPRGSSSSRGRRGDARTSSNGPLAQHFRVLAAGTTFQELTDAPPADWQVNQAAGGGTSEFSAEADAATRVSASPSTAAAPRASQMLAGSNTPPHYAHGARGAESARAAGTPEASRTHAAVAALDGEEQALHPATAASAESVLSDSRAPHASGQPPGGRDVTSITRLPDAASVVRHGRESMTRAGREASANEFSSYGGGPAAFAGGARERGGAAFSAPISRTPAASLRAEVEEAELSGGGPFAGPARGVRAPFVVAPAADETGARQFGQTEAGAAQSAAARERLFEELCERLEEAADELGID